MPEPAILYKSYTPAAFNKCNRKMKALKTNILTNGGDRKGKHEVNKRKSIQ